MFVLLGNDHETIAMFHRWGSCLVYGTELGKVGLLGKKSKLGGKRGQFCSGYFYFVFPYEEISCI